MANQRSPGAFCSIVVPNLTGANSLASLSFTKYGDGAQAYCIATRKSYRLNVSFPGPAASPVIIAASVAGFWIMEQMGGDGSASVNSTASRTSGISSQNTWFAMPSNAALYQAVSTSAIWTVNTTTGVSTYAGPTAKFLVQGNLAYNSTVTDEGFEMDLSINGATIGSTTTTRTATQQKYPGATATGVVNVSQALIVTLNNGDTVQHMIRTTLAGFGTIGVSNYNKTLTCLS
jgi:hypothetical protein